MNELITFLDAKKIAEDMAKERVIDLVPSNFNRWLDEYYLEAESCWMFFRNREIIIHEERTLVFGAYVVSKKGNARFIADFYDDKLRCEEYLLKMSNYFKDKGE